MTASVTWAWFGGFFQAEGSICRPFDQKGVSISQADREPLDLILDFLKRELPDLRFTGVRGPYKNRGKGIHKLSVYRGFTRVLLKLYPYLRGRKRERAKLWLEILAPYERLEFVDAQHELSDGWVAGFWEGDGHVQPHSDSAGLLLSFAQKDVSVLEEVRTYLGKGSITTFRTRVSHISRLTVWQGLREHPILNKVHEHLVSELRSRQVGSCIEAARIYLETSEDELEDNYGRPGHHMPPRIKALYQEHPKPPKA